MRRLEIVTDEEIEALLDGIRTAEQTAYVGRIEKLSEKSVEYVAIP